jgi:hypothetical protein
MAGFSQRDHHTGHATNAGFVIFDFFWNADNQ